MKLIPKRQYRLEIAFEKKKTSTLPNFKKMVRNTLSEFSKSVNLDVRAGKNNCYILSICGSLEKVDECHREIEEYFIKRLNYNFVRLSDEAGNEIRKRAYPVLARIEQRLRLFIENALVGVYGFGWWQKIAPSKLKTSVEKKESLESHRPLELMQFDELIYLINVNCSVWENNKLLTADEYLSLLNGCKSVDEVKKKLGERITPFSLWDNVFSRYFDNRDNWKGAEKAISMIIKQRHKVMHHRPFHINDLALIRKKEKMINSLITKHAKSMLSEEERSEVKKELNVIGGYLSELAQAFQVQQKLFSSSVSSSVIQSMARSLAPIMQAQKQYAHLQKHIQNIIMPKIDPSVFKFLDYLPAIKEINETTEEE